jgi:hypothetical protein
MKNIIIRNSNRFKSVFAQVNMLLPLTADNMSKNALLAMMLKKSNSKYKTERELERKLAELYNTSFGVGVGKVANMYDISFGLEILNVKYTGKEVLDEAIDILYTAICEPNFIDGKFDEKLIEQFFGYSLGISNGGILVYEFAVECPCLFHFEPIVRGCDI